MVIFLILEQSRISTFKSFKGF